MSELEKAFEDYKVCWELTYTDDTLIVDLRHWAHWSSYHLDVIRNLNHNKSPSIDKRKLSETNKATQKTYAGYDQMALQELIADSFTALFSEIRRLQVEQVPYRGRVKYSKEEFISVVSTHLTMHAKYLRQHAKSDLKRS